MISAFGIEHDISKGLPSALKHGTAWPKSEYAHALKGTYSHGNAKYRAKILAAKDIDLPRWGKEWQMAIDRKKQLKTQIAARPGKLRPLKGIA